MDSGDHSTLDKCAKPHGYWRSVKRLANAVASFRREGSSHPSAGCAILHVGQRETAPMPADTNLPLLWKQEAYRYAGGRCEVCGYEGPHLEAHHVISQGAIKREFRRDGKATVFSLLWDHRNAMLLCDEPAPNRCHTRHENWQKRIPQSKIREAHREFARELDARFGDERFSVRLERDYPLAVGEEAA